MPTALSATNGRASPSPNDARLAMESARKLEKLLGLPNAGVSLHIESDVGKAESIALPLPAVRLLSEILTEMAKGSGLALLPGQTELSCHQAAELLNVSFQYMAKLLDDGKIAHRPAGNDRRVRLDDLLAYKRSEDQARLRALEELSALDQKLNLGY